jgi:hypothetical protein
MRLRHAVSRAFPFLGPYAWVAPEEAPAAPAGPGDAVDDAVDTAREMRAIVWRWDEFGRDDATWHFEFGFRTHWGRHLMNLRSYPYARRFES